MRKKNVTVIFDRRKNAKKSGVGALEIKVYLGRDERMFETVGVSTPYNWMVMAQSLPIQAKMKHYEQIIEAMKKLNELMTIENFKRHVKIAQNPRSPKEEVLYNGHDLRQLFINWCREHLETETLAKNSIKDHNVVFNAVERSGILITLADLTKAKVIAFDQYLRSQKNKSNYTINGYHKKVKKYTKLLWQLEMIPSDPYQYVKFPKGSNKERNPLTEEELLIMIEAEYTGHLERARDLFIFMAYTGLAYCDMQVFNYHTMTEERADYVYIDGSRVKTGAKYFTPILPPAMDVLKKYNYKLPVISNQKINDYCHVIEKDLKIKRPVTCHVARHSFATLMLSYGFTLEAVMKMLGHKYVKTTQIYAKISKSLVTDEVEKKLKDLKLPKKIDKKDDNNEKK